MATKTNEQRKAEESITTAKSYAARLLLAIEGIKKQSSKMWYWGQKGEMDKAENAIKEAQKALAKLRYSETGL